MREHSGRVLYVDGLRAIAVLGVIFCHAGMVMPPMHGVSHVLLDGAHGVDLFFVLSGFCLAYPTLRRLRVDGTSSFDLVRFASHRLVRILPPFYLAMAVLLAACALVSLRTGAFVVPGAHPFGLADLLKQPFFLDRGTSMVNPTFWTLMVEFRWYLAFPFLLLAYVRSPRAYAALIAAVLAAFWFTRMHNLDLGVLPAFMLGIVAADWHITRHPIARYALPLALLALIVGVLQEPFAQAPDENGVDQSEFFSQTLPGWHFAAFFFVLAASRPGMLQRALSHRWLAAIGLISYSVYLVHYPIVMAVAPLVARHGVVPTVLTASVLAVAGGAAFWALCERPFSEGASRDRFVAMLAVPVRRLAAMLALPATFSLEPTAAPPLVRPVELHVEPLRFPESGRAATPP